MNTIQIAIEQVQQSIDLLAEYEKTIWPDQCQQASRAVLTYIRPWEELVPASEQEQVLIRLHFAKRPRMPVCSSPPSRRIVAVQRSTT